MFLFFSLVISLAILYQVFGFSLGSFSDDCSFFMYSDFADLTKLTTSLRLFLYACQCAGDFVILAL